MSDPEKQSLFRIEKIGNTLLITSPLKEPVKIKLETDYKKFEYCTRVYDPINENIYFLKPNICIPAYIFQGVIHSAPPYNNKRFFYF